MCLRQTTTVGWCARPVRITKNDEAYFSGKGGCVHTNVDVTTTTTIIPTRYMSNDHQTYFSRPMPQIDRLFRYSHLLWLVTVGPILANGLMSARTQVAERLSPDAQL